jgi:enoyl-CoA hydratase/carnithine racemase
LSADIYVEREDGVATIVLNRPEKRNAISYEGWLELRRLAEEIATDEDIRVVVLRGAGEQSFSAGADIKDFDRFRTDSEQAKVYQAAFDAAVDAIEALPVPTICHIKGFCIGGGCELTLAADLRIAADNGRFAIPAARLGIVVGHHEISRLVRLVGPGNASYILLTGRTIDAADAFRIGLVTTVVPLAESDGYVVELAREIVELAPLSHRVHKQILRRVMDDSSSAELTDQEADLPFVNFDSEDFQEGRQAFLERRKPRFTGR